MPTVTAGLDLMDFGQNMMGSFDSEDVGRKAFKIRGFVQDFQETFTSIEKVKYDNNQSTSFKENKYLGMI